MESKKKQYIAVTVGPIFATMSLVSTPAALWVSSYLFSCITKTICGLLLRYGVKEEEIISPYFSATDTALLDKKDGVGLFHDRIIFAADNFNIKDFNRIKDETLAEISDVFEIDAEYLKEYIQIAAVKYEAENPVFGCADILNSRELEKPFVAEDTEQPLLKLLFGGKTSSNEWIKELAKKLGVNEKWQLTDGKGIKDLKTIVNPCVGNKLKMKKHGYYAIVRSDGDNMSKIIASLNGDEAFRSFSKNCLTYCSEIADEVANFGGVTIYAGGDDLLAILPCENKNGETPFDFVKRANEIFKKNFDPYQKPIALSFGITMCYYKFPLYEALEDSAYLLFGVAKNENRKNCIAVRLQKHSGQTEGLVIPNEALDEFLSLKNVMGKTSDFAQNGEAEKEERIILSALHKLLLFESLLKATDSNREAIVTLFQNIFDSGEQKTNFLHQQLPDFYYKLKTSLKIDAMTGEGIISDPVTDITYVLRILKFFNEKAGAGE